MTNITHPSDYTQVGIALQDALVVDSEMMLIPPPSHNEISVRAYYIYLQDGCQPGRCHDNWHKAKQALESEGRASVWARDANHDKTPASYIPANPMTQHTLGTMAPSKVAGIG